MSIWDRIKYEFSQKASPIRKLIIINVAIFVVSWLVMAVARYMQATGQAQQLMSIFYLPPLFKDLILKPWTVFTYMFFHDPYGLRHIFGNMLMLYFFGRILLDFQSNKQFYTYFFGGGIAGAVLFLLATNFMPSLLGAGPLRPLIGASGGVIAVVVATAVLVPNYEVFLFGAFRVKVKWIAAILVAIDFVYYSAGNQGGHLAHIGGAAFGALMMLQTQGRINLNIFQNVRNPFKPKFTVLDERDILKNRKTGSSRKTTRKAEPFDVNKPRQEEIDAILDKIGQSGYDSLSKEEKELLFRASE